MEYFKVIQANIDKNNIIDAVKDFEDSDKNYKKSIILIKALLRLAEETNWIHANPSSSMIIKKSKEYYYKNNNSDKFLAKLKEGHTDDTHSNIIIFTKLLFKYIYKRVE